MENTEIKSLIEAGNRTIEAIRTDVKADAEKLAKMQADLAANIDARQAAETKMKAIEDRLAEFETKANRPSLGGERTSERKAAFADFLRTGSADALNLLTKATDSRVAVDASGGYAVEEVLESSILKMVRDISPIRGIAKQVTLRNEAWRQVVDLGGATANWIGETDTRTQTATPDLGELTLSFGELSAEPEATTKALHDTIIDVESWLVGAIVERFATSEGIAFVSGNGTNKPKGFLAGPTPVATGDATRAFGTLQFFATGAAAALGSAPFDVLHRTIYGTKSAYRANARFVMNSASLSEFARAKDENGQYLLQPAVAAGVGDRLLGYGVTVAEDMPDIAANAFPIAFGDFAKGYLIADIAGMTLIRDPYTKSGWVKFKAAKRVGGGLLDTQALKLVKIAA